MHLVSVCSFNFLFVLGNLTLALLPQLLNGRLEARVQQSAQVHTLHCRVLQLPMQIGKLLGRGARGEETVKPIAKLHS